MTSSLKQAVQLCLVAILVVLAVVPLQATTHAQDGQRCFVETGHCISGPIRAYWEANGGLSIFGYPITNQRIETVEGRTLTVQWFERDRLEIQNDGSITAGRLGAQLLELQGRPWESFPREEPQNSPNCTYFAVTGHNTCDIFLWYWQNNGGLERFGYPITPAMREETDGQSYLVQYFERRRMELHPEHAGTPYEVLLGLLGNALVDAPSSPAAWRGVLGVPTTVELTDVQFANDTRAWAIGNDGNAGYLYQLDWIGDRWNVTEDRSFSGLVTSLSVVSAGEVWLTTPGGLIFHRVNGEWPIAHAPLVRAQLNTIAMLGVGESGYAGGSVERTDDQGRTYDETLLVRYEPTQNQWIRDESVKIPGRITSISVAADHAFLVGRGEAGPFIYHFQNGSWSNEPVARACGPGSGCFDALFDVQTTVGGMAWAVGTYGSSCAICVTAGPYAIRRVQDRWEKVLPDPNAIVGLPDRVGRRPQMPLNDIEFFLFDGDGIAVGLYADSEQNLPLILRYRAGTWRAEIPEGITGKLNAISRSDVDRALTVGENGLILSYGY